jgi:hypothetical protein
MSISALSEKSFGHVEFGFAAGVGFAAVALPRQTRTPLTFGYAPGAAFGLIINGQSPHEGRSPGNKPADVGA